MGWIEGEDILVFEHKQIQSLEDFFLQLHSRAEKGVFFYRINGYSEPVRQFISRYYDMALKKGVVIEGKLPNPTEQNLSYYREIMGMDFKLNIGFITAALKKWLPRMNDSQRANVAAAILDTLTQLGQKGKTESMLQNAYIKFMCWLYYKFERIVNQLGEDDVPKILYEGAVTNYELLLFCVLSKAGCDIVLLQYQGDENYQKLDAASFYSDALHTEGLQPFPTDFSLKKIREEARRSMERERLYGPGSVWNGCINTWMDGNVLEEIRKEPSSRGSEAGVYYNALIRMDGAQDKLTYADELYRFGQDLKAAKRHTVIVDHALKKPDTTEILGIRRGNYADAVQMITGLSSNISFPADPELQKLMHRAFVDIFLEKASGQTNLNRLISQAVTLLCWLKRYESSLFTGLHLPQISCFILYGGCHDESEALFLRFLARLPVDVLILTPKPDETDCLKDNNLCEIHFSETVSLEHFPQESSQVKIGTVAYHAERELDSLMYQDTGLYRQQQYSKANIIQLQTIYEEIRLLWDEELKYRQSFSVTDGTVNLPVIFARVSGIKDRDLNSYWGSVKELLTEDTLFLSKFPYIDRTIPNPVKQHAVEFYKNGRLLKDKIRNHTCYPYGILREETQELILDKLQLLLQQKLIKGIGENGTEYTVIATVLNLPKEIVRLIQKFDLTKKNPKLVWVNTTEDIMDLEDTIMVMFLHLLGFDILFFIPTGYRNIEKYMEHSSMEDHQIGEYMYDLQMPDLNRLVVKTKKKSLGERLFGRR
ncbi:MAG: hypothetical protein E7294_10580 [Lachnospiraceae bacterium]|jgi:hypothetical protein|nr:hypothetical protein [Lachnospiraceae bacterium]